MTSITQNQTPGTSSASPSFLPSPKKGFAGMAQGLLERKALWGSLLIALVILLVSWTVWSTRQKARDNAARIDLFLAEKALEVDLKTIAQTKLPAAQVLVAAAAAKNKDSKAPKTPLPTVESEMDQLRFAPMVVETQFPEGLRRLRAVTETHPNTRASFEAELILGDLHRNHGEVAKSVPWYQKAVTEAPNAMDRALANLALAHAYEDTKQAGAAVSVFELVLNSGQTGLKGEALLGIARASEAAGNVARARSAYDQIIQQMAEAPEAKTAEGLKALLPAEAPSAGEKTK